MPELTHCRGTVSALPSSLASTMPATFGTYAAMLSNVRLRAFQSRRLIGETRVRGDAGVCSQSMTSRSGSGNGRGRSRIASTNANIALLAPMPSASISTAAAAKTRSRVSVRVAYRRSWRRSSNIGMK